MHFLQLLAQPDHAPLFSLKILSAGAVEAIFSILAIRDQIAPPTINLDNPDEGCDINLVPNAAQQMPIQVCISNSFGFGGTNGSLVFKRFN